MPRLDRPDLSLHYEVGGDGPPLMMIAGMLSDSASWGPLVPLLEPHFTLIRPDNRTTGRSAPWDAPVSLALMAEDVLALLDHLKHTHAHVIGHSMGGFVALHLCQTAPDRIASATLAASAPLPMARNARMFRDMLAVRLSNCPPHVWIEQLFGWLFSPAFFEDPAALSEACAAALAYPFAQSPEAMDHQIAAFEAMDLSGLLGPTSVPRQTILGDLDMPIPLPLAQPLLTPHMPVHVVQNAAHSIHWEAPQAVADHLKTFTEALS